MATRKTTSEAAPILISTDRQLVALEAIWEIDALNAAVCDLCDHADDNQDQGQLMRLRLQVRGLTRRIRDLNNTVLAALDDPNHETLELKRAVFGHEEVAHG